MEPAKLAEAGFFHCDQRGDTVACYVCAVRVWHWRGEHDPWIVHYAANKHCELVHFMKSREWIKKAPQIAVVVLQSDYFDISASPSNATIRNGLVVQKSAENSLMFLEKVKHSCGADVNTDNTCHNNNFMCSICLASKVEVLFEPCKHIVSCSKCSLNVDSCCVCRRPIVKYVRVFFP